MMKFGYYDELKFLLTCCGDTEIRLLWLTHAIIFYTLFTETIIIRVLYMTNHYFHILLLAWFFGNLMENLGKILNFFLSSHSVHKTESCITFLRISLYKSTVFIIFAHVVRSLKRFKFPIDFQGKTLKLTLFILSQWSYDVSIFKESFYTNFRLLYNLS